MYIRNLNHYNLQFGAKQLKTKMSSSSDEEKEDTSIKGKNQQAHLFSSAILFLKNE